MRVVGIKIDGGDKALKIGETLQLTATIEPSDATNTAVIWESSDSNKATVDEKGLVTAIEKPGANITVITKDGDYEDTIAVFVGMIANTNNSVSPGATCDPCNPCDPCDPCNTCEPDPCNPCNTCEPDLCNPCDPCNPCEPEPCDPCDPCGDCYNPCECQSNSCNVCN